MNRRTRRLLFLSPLLLLLLIAGAYLLLDAWLEGAGGRRAVEAALTERLGVPVRLQGQFRVMLLPSVGVSGTDLVIGLAGAEAELGRSGEFAVTLAVLPLLDGELLVESFELHDGRFYIDRFTRSVAAAEGDADPADLRLPEIHSLEVSEFRIITGDGATFHLKTFAVEDFAAGTAAPFELAVEDYGVLEGRLNWDAGPQRLAVDAIWSGLLPGAFDLRAVAGLASGSGSLQAEWRFPAGGRAGPGLRADLTYARAPDGIAVHDIVLEAGGQSVRGEGCLLTAAALSLQLELETEAIDFDALPDPGVLTQAFGDDARAPAADDAAAGSRFDLRLRLRAGEARLQGAVARDAVLGVGAEPDCGALNGLAGSVSGRR